MDLLAPDFDLVRGRPAYPVAEVDEAVAETRRLLAGYGGWLPSGRGGFTLVRDEGYDAAQVDAWSTAVRRALADRAEQPDSERPVTEHHLEDPPELRGIPADEPYGPYESSFPAWVRVTALVLAVAVALFFVASYFV